MCRIIFNMENVRYKYRKRERRERTAHMAMAVAKKNRQATKQNTFHEIRSLGSFHVCVCTCAFNIHAACSLTTWTITWWNGMVGGCVLYINSLICIIHSPNFRSFLFFDSLSRCRALPFSLTGSNTNQKVEIKSKHELLMNWTNASGQDANGDKDGASKEEEDKYTN